MCACKCVQGKGNHQLNSILCVINLYFFLRGEEIYFSRSFTLKYGGNKSYSCGSLGRGCICLLLSLVVVVVVVTVYVEYIFLT